MTTILTVDDSTSMRKIVTFTLKQAGFDVIEAVDGVDALEKVNSNKIDFVLADVNMPRMDGIDLTQELRALPSFKFTPIFILTTETGDMKAKGKAAGATGWIVKPFNTERLLDVVQKFLH